MRMYGQAVMSVGGDMVVFLSCLLEGINVYHRHAQVAKVVHELMVNLPSYLISAP